MFVLSFLQLLLFFTFTVSFLTFSLQKRGPNHFRRVDTLSSFIEREQLFGKHRNQFYLPFFWSNLFSVFAIYDQRFIPFVWFYLSHGLMASTWVNFIFINFLYAFIDLFICFCFDSVLDFVHNLISSLIHFNPHLFVSCWLYIQFEFLLLLQ